MWRWVFLFWLDHIDVNVTRHGLALVLRGADEVRSSKCDWRMRYVRCMIEPKEGSV